MTESLQDAFERLLEQDPATRTSELARLRRTDAAQADALQRMLAHDDAFERDALPEPAARWTPSVPDDEGFGSERFGRYRLLAQIGAGGMGRVYTAVRTDDPQERVFALKTLRRDAAGPLLVQRFALECEALASLSHPGIAAFVEAGRGDAGTPFVVMDHVEGEPIDAWCDRRRLPLRARIELVQQLLAAVEHAHQRLIIHRDIKPANVLVDADGRVTLVDFGIAKSLATAHASTATAERFLTPRTAAPEQLQGGAIGTACDVHGAGLLLYVLLCGREPFDYDGADPLRFHEQLLRIPAPAMTTRLAGADAAVARNRGLPSIAALQSLLRGDLERVVLRCLRKRPDERYPGVHELDRDLRCVLDDRPISERENERWYRFRKFVQRNRAAFALSVASVALLCVALLVVLHQRQQALRERDRAESAIGLLQDSFAAADPLNTQGGVTRVSEVLNAALPLLERQREQQPGLYAELASTMAQVELAAGRPQQALQLSTRAIAAANATGNDAAVHALRMLQARATLEAGALQDLPPLLDGLTARTPREAVQLTLLRGRLAYLQGDPQGAVDALTRAFDAAKQLPGSDPLTLDVRLYLAQAQRLAENAPAALALLDEALTLQSQQFDAQHPRVLVTRLRRLEYARPVLGAEAALPQMLALADEIADALGPRSAPLARARASIAQAYMELGDAPHAIRYFRLAWQDWRTVASPGHPNALRSLFNLAYASGTTDAGTDDVDRLFRRLMDEARAGGELSPEITNYWRVSHLEFLAGRQRCEQALSELDRYFGDRDAPLLNPPTRDLLAGVIGSATRDCRCDAAATASCATAHRIGVRIAQPAPDAQP